MFNMTQINEKEIDHRFKLHSCNEHLVENMANIRSKAAEFADLIGYLCPDGLEKSIAVTKLEEVMFWANVSIARQGDLK